MRNLARVVLPTCAPVANLFCAQSRGNPTSAKQCVNLQQKKISNVLISLLLLTQSEIFLVMELERYNQSFEEHVTHIEEEADARLQAFRQKCLRNFVIKLTRQQDEWETTFREILNKSQEETPELRRLRNVSFNEKPEIKLIENCLQPIEESQQQEEEQQQQPAAKPDATPINLTDQKLKDTSLVKDVGSITAATPAPGGDTVDNAKLKATESTTVPIKAAVVDDSDDPFPIEQRDHFTNNLAVKEFIRVQELQEQNRKLLLELNTNPALKPFKNELNLCIRTQINSISTMDDNNISHISAKIKLLVNLFTGNSVNFQDKLISASKHPQGQLLAMDLAAQTFVTVGSRLVNTVPAIAVSMAIVINGIVKCNLFEFRDLVIGHIQERCPYIIPMYPRFSDFDQHADAKVKHKIACGYSYDLNTKQLENEEKYLARMRSMALIFARILILQDNKGYAWSWLASFLSLEPQAAITATILQAFLQETSRDLLLAYKSQFRKLLAFIRTDYVKMIEQVTKQPQERQPLIKLKNQLSEV